jgi:hypothetical protein
MLRPGGGTNFPLLGNLTVMPKKGRALIWPSVLDEDPNAKDARTDHQALPVRRESNMVQTHGCTIVTLRHPLIADVPSRLAFLGGLSSPVVLFWK